MQLTLQITAGPHTGRKVLLRSGQVARIGRTEWADFSFPKDGDLAEVHFAVQCQLHGARLRKLATDRPLSVNLEEVTERELKPGDSIQAGNSAFLVSFDGVSAMPLGAVTATIGGATIAAAPFVGAASAEQASQEPSAVEIAEHLQMADDHIALAKTVRTGPELVAALAASGAFAKAVRVQAHLLSKRLAIWWGILCVEQVCGEGLSSAEIGAKQAALEWLEKPGETRRRQCEAAAGKTKLDAPGGWLAMAAFWNSGSLAPEDMGPVPPDDKLTGQAIANSLMIAAVSGDATKAKDRYRMFLAKALEVAKGKPPLPEPPA